MRENAWLIMPKTMAKEAMQSMKRNSLISIAAVISIVAALIILGVFLVLSINIRNATGNVESNLEIKAFMSSDYSQEQKSDFEEALAKNPAITSVHFESEEEALSNFSSTIEDYSNLLSNFNAGNNPLPASFVIKAKDAESLEEVKAFISSYEGKGIEYIKHGEDYINALMNFNRFMNTLSVVMLVVLSLISFYLIYNTIRLTMFARRKEINIMKYIGATNAYIQTPFVLEGTILGIIGALVSVLVLRFGYYYLLGAVSSTMMISVTSALASPNAILTQLLFIFVAYGVVIGTAGSVFAIRKFLDV